MNHWIGCVLSTAWALTLLASAQPPGKPAAGAAAPSPQEALKQFQITARLRLELAAAEPQIESPVAMAFDEDGRLWVVEMRDYPNGPAAGRPPEGRIKLLEDRDGDGRFESARVHADNLLFANGVLPWRGGLLVTAAPHIVHIKDSKTREILYEGFAAQNPQLRVSHPNLGIDNWVYVANGLRNGMVKRTSRADAPLNLSGMDFRFHPLRDRHEAVSGLGQFGLTCDDWGRRFVCDNRHHLRHVVLPDRYVKRNPFLAAPAVVEDISVLGDGPLNSGGKIYPLSKNWTTSSLHVGRFTAACGVFVYRGDLLPGEFRDCVFTCDPTGNLVHQEVLTPHGATFRSRPPRDGVEFLASPDEWFRPVFLSHGPDGALYVVDMGRAVIEHPEFMPPELKNRPDLTLGKDRGRIWRVVPEKPTARPGRPQLSKAAIPELVALLEHPNAWQRTTAQRLLLERNDRAAVGPLVQLLNTSKEPRARLHAAWLLESQNALHEGLVLLLLQDGHPRLREQGILLAEPFLPHSPKIQTRLLALAEDPDPQVRYQLALSLGDWDDDRIVPPLVKIGLAGADDRWTRLAVASSLPTRAGAYLAAALGSIKQMEANHLLLFRELATLVGARREPTEVTRVLRLAAGDSAPRVQVAALNGLAEGLARRGSHLGSYVEELPASDASVRDRVAALFRVAADAALDSQRDATERLDAVRLLAHAAWPLAQAPLARLLAEAGAQEVRLAAVRSLAGHRHADVPAALVKGWKAYAPAVRREVVEALLRQPDRTLFLLQEVEAGRIRASEIDPTRTRQLVKHKRPEIQALAQKVLAAHLPADRKQVLSQYQPALTAKGDAARGKAVFQKHCATCHRVGTVGVDVGPDIADTRTKTPEMLLLDILNPNQAIDSNYVNYLVTTKSGKVLTGVLAAETASSITLRRAENQTDVVLRQDIDEIQSTGVSLMPEGLEKTIPIPEMADLLAFLKNWRYLDGSVPLGR